MGDSGRARFRIRDGGRPAYPFRSSGYEDIFVAEI